MILQSVTLLATLAFVGSILIRTERYVPTGQYPYKTKYFNQQIDHFNFRPKSATFKQKYLVNTDHLSKGGPILFYTGNEGTIELFCENTGFMWELAPRLKAAVVFAEHRYYGDSMPFGNLSYSSQDNRQFFTTEQALADFATLIVDLRATYPGSKVVAFGGSYGGMLAAWIRMRYPHLVDGAIAASAPVWQWYTPCEAYNEIVTQDFEVFGGVGCVTNIRRGHSLIASLGVTEAGRKTLSEALNLCTVPSETAGLIGFIDTALANVAMVNYPYPANFLGPMPAWPVKVMCDNLRNGSMSNAAVLSGMHKLVTVFYNYTGSRKCFDVDNTQPAGLDDNGWGYQSCTEMTMPMCANNRTDFFPPSPWNETNFVSGCMQSYGVVPRLAWTKTSFWGHDFSSASNIVFSNGLLDPWSAGGVLKPLNAECPTVLIARGAHHLDLRAAHPTDLPEVIAARQIEEKYVRQWTTSTVKAEPVMDI